jgi:uncharacterized protein (DUF2342 family)
MDISDPTRLREMLGDEVFLNPRPSPQTEEAAAGVTTFLSVIGACVAVAIEQAGTRVGDTARIAEAFARIEAEAGPGIRAFAGFIGIDLPPAGRRAARTFADRILAAGGWSTIARLFEDTDAFPSAGEIADPDAWLRRVAS